MTQFKTNADCEVVSDTKVLTQWFSTVLVLGSRFVPFVLCHKTMTHNIIKDLTHCYLFHTLNSAVMCNKAQCFSMHY